MDEVPDLFATVSAASERDERRLRSPEHRARMRSLQRLHSTIGVFLTVAASILSIIAGLLFLGLEAPELGVPGVGIGVTSLIASAVRWLSSWRHRRAAHWAQQLTGFLAVSYVSMSPFFLLVALMSAFW